MRQETKGETMRTQKLTLREAVELKALPTGMPVMVWGKPTTIIAYNGNGCYQAETCEGITGLGIEDIKKRPGKKYDWTRPLLKMARAA